MTNKKALESFEKLLKDIELDNHLFVGTINPEFIEAAIEALRAQPEIIRCKDCKHHHYERKGIPYCDNIDYGYGWKDDDFCSKAERRTDD